MCYVDILLPNENHFKGLVVIITLIFPLFMERNDEKEVVRPSAVDPSDGLSASPRLPAAFPTIN